MKSTNQILEQHMHHVVRSKVRSCSQPGTLLNIMDHEMQMFITDVLQKKLRDEQDELLQRGPYERNGDGRQRNGCKPVRFKGLFRSFRVRRPVLRGKTPPSPIISLFQSLGKALMITIASRFWLRGASTRAVAEEINHIAGTKLSSSDISHFSDSVLPDVQEWCNRSVPKNIAYLFVDAIYLPAQKIEFTTDVALLGAIGMTPDGKRHVLGFLLGDRENTDSWSALLKDLLNRGLDRNTLRLVISDEHKAIVAAVEQTLGVTHQLCILHKMRNALVRVHGKHRKTFYADFKAAFWAETKDEALRALGRLEATWGRLYPKATAIACANPVAFLHFMDQPKPLWTILRSTNLIERFNRELRRRLNPAGAIHGENSLFKLVWSISIEQEKRWAKRSLRNVKELELKLAA